MAQARYIVADGVEVSSAEDRDFYQGIFGADLRVLDVGSKFDYEITSNTTITVADGVLVCEGGRLQITNGTIDTFVIPTGTANVTSYYILGYKVYADGTEVEQVVRKVSNANSIIERASIRGGSNESIISLYRVVQEGINIISVTPLFETAPNIGSVYPVGSQLMSISNVNPSTYLGGTWSRVSSWEAVTVNGSKVVTASGGRANMHTITEIKNMFNTKYGFTPTLKATDSEGVEYDDLGVMYTNGDVGANGSLIGSGKYGTQYIVHVTSDGGIRVNYTYLTHRTVYSWRRTA